MHLLMCTPDIYRATLQNIKPVQRWLILGLEHYILQLSVLGNFSFFLALPSCKVIILVVLHNFSKKNILSPGLEMTSGLFYPENVLNTRQLHCEFRVRARD